MSEQMGASLDEAEQWLVAHLADPETVWTRARAERELAEVQAARGQPSGKFSTAKSPCIRRASSS